ncbi:serine hydrolase domain-containing protein [Oryzifoliimicrobium ureilyticus]|uniref:serine hydrolase domain-containing protein n=1 Tax=Oryzifoliimicrobium ureilyticus TaxID=3113724 RepID=UPI0030765FED
MSFLKSIVIAASVSCVVIVGGAVAWLSVSPPELLRVGDGYAAKIVCSNVFIAGRDASEVFGDDVQAPGNPILRFIRVSVDKERRTVKAGIFGLFAPSYALYRGRYGCATVPDGDLEGAEKALAYAPVQAGGANPSPWPDGEGAGQTNPSVQALLGDSELAGPGIRALLVVRDGQIIGESYGPGFDAKTPLLGWSMTKTVNAAVVGMMMKDGKMSFADNTLFSEWRADDRAKIKLSDLLAMQSGLAFDESYGVVTDATRMLYLDRDMVRLPLSKPLAAPPGSSFVYSTGSAVLLSRLWMNRIGDTEQALSFPYDRLFGPLGMTSAVLEADAQGTYVGGSYLYATPRDWARFGQLLVQDGVWKGERLLPEEFMQAMRTPTKPSAGLYGGTQNWLSPPGMQNNQQAGLPEDVVWLQGHDGQSIAIVPSARLILVRMGLTPSSTAYGPQVLLRKILDAIR